MGLKKKLAMGVATGALAVSMIGGGTYAYFSSTAEATSTFAAGSLDLSVSPTSIISIDNLKPGDWMNREFNLVNGGTLDISKVLLTSDYTESVQGFGEHIVVEFLKNDDKGGTKVIDSMTLSALKNFQGDAVDNRSPEIKKIVGTDKFPFFKIITLQDGEADGLIAGDQDLMKVRFKFKDNGEDQNAYQNANLNLTWTFHALQTAGEEK